MRNKIIYSIAISISVVIIIVLIGLFLYPSAIPHNFKSSCKKIEVGMSKEQVLKLMNNYVDREEYLFFQDEEGFFWYTEKLFDDWQCNVYLQDDVVIGKREIFD